MKVSQPTRQLRVIMSASAIAAAMFLFYFMLQRYAINIPSGDDYDCALEFLNKMAVSHSLGEKILIFVTTQHNEYKPLVGSAIFWLQYAVFGHLDFGLARTLGNLTPIAVACAVWPMFLPRARSFSVRFALFVPAAFLIFNLAYSEAMDAPMAALQYLPALAFAFAAIQLLLDGRRTTFILAALCFAASAFSSTNGMILLPIGLAILLRAKAWWRVGIWGVFFACLFWLYNFRYIASHPPHAAATSASPALTLLVLKPLYAIGVIGAAAGLFRGPWTYLLGITLIAFFLWRRRFFRRNQAMLYSAVFMACTAAGIAHIRFSLGLQFHASSRYMMYSLLLLAFAWAVIAETWVLNQDGDPRVALNRDRLFAIACLVTSAYVLTAAWKSHNFLRERAEDYKLSLAVFEHPEDPVPAKGPVPAYLTNNNPVTGEPYYRRVITESIHLGVYRPPQYPQPSAMGIPYKRR